MNETLNTNNTENESSKWDELTEMIQKSASSPETSSQVDENSSENVSAAENIDSHEKMESVPLTPENNVYREIAKNALENWNGLSSEEAEKEASEKSVDELEGSVYAMGSIESATNGIFSALEKRGIYSNADDGKKVVDAVINSDKTAKPFENLSEKLEKVGDKENFVLDVLSSIHDQWVEDNAKKLADPARENKRYQGMPLELIGYKEAKSDLLFVQPILEASGMDIDDEKLKEAYNDYGAIDTKAFKDFADDEIERSELADWDGSKPYPALGKFVLAFAEQTNSAAEEKGEQAPIDFNNVKSPSEDENKNREAYGVEVAKQLIEKLDELK